MSNISTFNNLFVSLSQSAYENKPNNFQRLLRKSDLEILNYSQDYYESSDTIAGGKNLPNNGIVYVHKDKNTRLVPKDTPNGTVFIKTPLLSDIEEGFNSYFLTDTPELNKDTKNAYLAVKGSDVPSLNNVWPLVNDWLGNNYRFAMNDEYIPQGKIVAEALHVKLAEL